MTEPDWPCEAYGPDGLAHGARCFVAAELWERHCPTASACHSIMQTERRKLWDRLQLAAGNPLDPEAQLIARTVLEGFTGPDQLLGGQEDE